MAIDTLFILSFTVLCACLDFDAMASRPQAWLQISKEGVFGFLYAMHAWFAVYCIAGVIGLGIIHGPGSFLFNFLNMIDFLLACAGLVRVDFVPALNVLRLFRVIHYISLHPWMEFLKEIIQLISESMSLLLSSIGIMFFSSLFLAMFINNLVVEYRH